MAPNPRREGLRSETGSLTLEYLGLAALAVVIIFVTIIAVERSSWREGVRSVQCEVLNSGCSAAARGPGVGAAGDSALAVS